MDMQGMMSQMGSGGGNSLPNISGGAPPGGMASSQPQMEIAKKMGKGNRTPEAQSVDSLIVAIKALNNYADVMAQTDESNARTARVMIGILGEILRAQQHNQMQEPPANIMGPDFGLGG